MLSTLSFCIQKNNYSEAELLCQHSQNILKGNMLFHALYGVAAYHTQNYSTAVEQLITAIQCKGPYKLANICHRNLARINYSIPPKPSLSCFPRSNSVVLTITSCKRLDLLKRMLSSLSYLDLHNVADAYIIDDGSDEKELQEIVDTFDRHFHGRVRLQFKPTSERGHGSSMNYILEYIKQANVQYILHIEDDFEFRYNMPLIQHCVNVLEETPHLGQCLFNNAYKEDFNEVLETQTFGLERVTSSGYRYLEHIYTKDHQNPSSYWPHFSLRAGITRANTLLQIGKFLETGSFEKEYALRYVNAGWKSAYLEGVYYEHIGRKTKDRFSTQNNAYSLNKTIQFGISPIAAFVLNLTRRRDRLDILQFPTSPPITIISSIDGRQLQSCRELNTLFKDNHADMKPGIVGCALTHIKLWLQLTESYEKIPHYLILEDDVTFNIKFESIFTDVLKKITNEFVYWDIIFLGYHMTSTITELNWIQPRTFEQAFSISRGGTFGYIINHTGARALLSFIKHFGMINAIDTVIQKCINYGLKVFYLNTPIIHSIEQSIDSDIQKKEPILYSDKYKSDATWNEIESYISSFSIV